jgi:predicted phosphodiesterase
MTIARYRRVGFIGDIHAEDQLLERALDVLASRGVELVAATGDVADGPGSVDRCCSLLQSRGVVVVRGNHDLQNLLRGGYRWILNGHSHRRMVRHFGRATVINAGTLLRSHEPCFLELDFENGTGLVFTFEQDGRITDAPEAISLIGSG